MTLEQERKELDLKARVAFLYCYENLVFKYYLALDRFLCVILMILSLFLVSGTSHTIAIGIVICILVCIQTVLQAGVKSEAAKNLYLGYSALWRNFENTKFSINERRFKHLQEKHRPFDVKFLFSISEVGALMLLDGTGQFPENLSKLDYLLLGLLAKEIGLVKEKEVCKESD